MKAIKECFPIGECRMNENIIELVNKARLSKQRDRKLLVTHLPSLENGIHQPGVDILKDSGHGADWITPLQKL